MNRSVIRFYIFFKSNLRSESMNWVQRKIYLYNVTFGLYMLDWWERCLFSILLFYYCSRILSLFQLGFSGTIRSRFAFFIFLFFMIEGKFWRFSCLDFLCMVDILVILLMWFVCYNGARNASEFCKRYLVSFPPRWKQHRRYHCFCC